MISIGTAIGITIGTAIVAFTIGSWFGLLIAGLMITASDERKDKKR